MQTALAEELLGVINNQDSEVVGYYSRKTEKGADKGRGPPTPYRAVTRITSSGPSIWNDLRDGVYQVEP